MRSTRRSIWSFGRAVSATIVLLLLTLLSTTMVARADDALRGRLPVCDFQPLDADGQNGCDGDASLYRVDGGVATAGVAEQECARRVAPEPGRVAVALDLCDARGRGQPPVAAQAAEASLVKE